eukprot:CAMPEP_0185311050 /NCGR_PEP_ID=MMETSP1363-20130426/25733_1 /TAXON_ID=38817 /ORGANISM="Gephyrocapsa oceanica, Strain RCC1303" /LENGTH=66 /DNA_ID=CAMNT_0027908647 /DNA_START=56 /DNA_END=253 /DNA_ORIENTATION=-
MTAISLVRSLRYSEYFLWPLRLRLPFANLVPERSIGSAHTDRVSPAQKRGRCPLCSIALKRRWKVP